MTFAPATLRRLGTYWTEQGGVNLGVVGDANHTAGYHLGKDRIYAPSGLGGADYSVQLERDKRGLSDASAAIDLGRLAGSLPALYRFSDWLVDQARAGQPGTRDIREVIYSPDGRNVQRYSGVDGVIHTGPGNGDATHLTHTHISYYRDAEARDKVAAFAPYFEDDDMPSKQAAITTVTPKLMDVPKGAKLLDLDGSTELYVNAFDRPGTVSPYGSGSVGGFPRRAMYIDPDGTGTKNRRIVLVVVKGPLTDVDTPGEPEAYEVVVGGKPVGSVTLP